MSVLATGDRVLLVGPDTPEVMATRETLEAAGHRLVHRPEPSPGADDPVAAASDTLGGLDVLVRWTPRPSSPRMDWSDPTVFAEDVDRMLVAAHRHATAAARVMAGSHGPGRPASIVFVGTVDASHAYPGRASASTAMAGMLGLVRALGVELAPSGIRVNAVLVGPVGGPTWGPPPGIDEALIERTLIRSPQGRFVTPQEVAAAIGFVTGPRAGFMTGQALSVDGGWSALNQAPDGLRFP